MSSAPVTTMSTADNDQDHGQEKRKVLAARRGMASARRRSVQATRDPKPSQRTSKAYPIASRGLKSAVPASMKKAGWSTVSSTKMT